jgi:hypothetical protein
VGDKISMITTDGEIIPNRWKKGWFGWNHFCTGGLRRSSYKKVAKNKWIYRIDSYGYMGDHFFKETGSSDDEKQLIDYLEKYKY